MSISRERMSSASRASTPRGSLATRARRAAVTPMQKNPKKKEKCKNCEGRGLVKQGDKKMKCQRCGGTGFKQ